MGEKPVLYDLPVSNNGARCRIIIYKKGIEDQVGIKSPMDLGGLKSPEYLKLNPQGKMPLLVADEITLPESDTISRYLLDRFVDAGPSFVPASPTERARSDLLCRLHDTYVASMRTFALSYVTLSHSLSMLGISYITSIQGALYKATPPFGIFGSRLDALKELRKQLHILNDAADPKGPFLAGAELSLADATVFPTLVFVAHMLPMYATPTDAPFDLTAELGPRLGVWYAHMQTSDPVFKRVHEEIQSALNGWSSKGRWNAILHAGAKDTGAPTIFDKIVAKEIPSDVVYEDEKVAPRQPSLHRISHLVLKNELVHEASACRRVFSVPPPSSLSFPPLLSLPPSSPLSRARYG
jgi:glutathione S-transferase